MNFFIFFTFHTILDVDECIDPLLNSCPSNSKCINIQGTYRCDCNNLNNNIVVDDDDGGGNHTSHSTINVSFDDSFCPKTCIINGMERKNGEQWPASLKDPCTICQCVKGVVSCEPKKCDCSQKNSIDSQCCPECHSYSSKKVCYHQENHHLVYKNGERWTYECETCECMVMSFQFFLFFSHVSFFIAHRMAKSIVGMNVHKSIA